MDHVAGSGNAIKFAVRNILMEPRRLLIDVDDPISLASDYANRHFKSFILITKLDRVRYH